MIKKHYWKTEDIFIDKYARTLSLKAQAVYSCLKRHAGGQFGHSNIGSRLISKKIGTSLNTAQSGLRELIEKGFISKRRGSYSTGYYTIYPLTQDISQQLNQNNIATDENNEPILKQYLGIKVNSKHIKEESTSYENQKRTPEEQERMNKTLEKMRKEIPILNRGNKI